MLVMMVMGLPAAVLFSSGNQLAGTLLLAIPFAVVCLIEPFVGICWLFAIAPVDSIFELIGAYASGSKLLGIPIGIGFIIHLLIRQDMRFTVPREVKLLWLLAVWAFISVLWSEFPRDSAWSASTIVLLSTFILMAIGLTRTMAHMRQLLTYVLLGCIVTSVLGMATNSLVSDSGRRSLSEVNPNLFARAMIFGIFAAIFLMAQTPRLLIKVFHALSAGFLLVTVAYTQSRGAYFALVAAVVVGMLVTYRKNILKVIVGLAIVGILLLALVAGMLHFGSFSTRAKERLLTPVSDAASSRMAIWSPGLRAVVERPLQGWGFNNFDVASSTGRDPHNVYLKLLVELGIPGLVMWLIVWVMLALRARRLIQPHHVFFLTGLLAANITGEFTINDMLGKTLWYEIGTCLALCTIFSQSQPAGHLGPNSFAQDMVYQKY